jgi:pimeloyl-ACP methyl ester carboxylesterase
MSATAKIPSRRSFLLRMGVLGAAAPALSSLAALARPEDALAADQRAEGAAAGTGREPAHKTAHEVGGTGQKLWSQEYWAQRGDIKLYMYRKRLGAPKGAGAAMPVLFLVHGSSISSRPSFDLSVPGRGEYSLMNQFAEYGFDVWTMDFEGYGRSSKSAGNSNIADGVADLKAAMEVVKRETGQERCHFFGESSGGLRAGAFAMEMPERVNRLVLAAFTYTGQGSPTLTDRAKQVDFYRTHNARPRDREMILSIFTRDKPGTSEPGVGDALADAELPWGDSVPTGTYLDMTANLPVVDPLKVHAPALIVRGEYDGIATEEDLVSFFQKLPNRDRQLVVLPGMAHSLVMGINRHEFWYVMRAFLNMPPRQDSLKVS